MTTKPIMRAVGRTGLAAVLAVLIAAPAAGQRRAPDHAAPLARLTERLDLTDAQQTAVREVLQVDDETGRRGDLWMVSSVLHDRLSAEQKEKLFSASREAAIFRRGMQAGMRREMAGRRRAVRSAPAPRPGSASAARPERIERMQEALGLSNDQVEILRIHDSLTGLMGARLGMRSVRMRRADAPDQRMRRMR